MLRTCSLPDLQALFATHISPMEDEEVPSEDEEEEENGDSVDEELIREENSPGDEGVVSDEGEIPLSKDAWSEDDSEEDDDDLQQLVKTLQSFVEITSKSFTYLQYMYQLLNFGRISCQYHT